MTPNNGSLDLSVIPDLQRITHDGQQALIAIARVIHMTSGSVLLYQGDAIHSFYLIQRGGVRLVEYTPDGQSVSLKIYGPGDVFGLLAISGTYPHATQIETIHDSTLLAFNGEETRRLMLVYPDIALFVIDRLTAHIHEAHHRLRAMAVERVEHRLARALLHLCDKFGVTDDGGVISIDAPLSQRDLAEFVSTSVETINRTLTQWSRQGIVRTSHRHIDVLDSEALQDLAENWVSSAPRPS